ncbi:hypothetical protein P4393_12520 [Bacillus subtilis]|nr:hypothetical protein [Bacillus subtilis]MED3474652.1 hypothetical protein [Bacillus subtilis]
MEKITVFLDSQLLGSVVDLISEVDLEEYTKSKGDQLDNYRKIVSFYQWTNASFGEVEKEVALYIKEIIFSELEKARAELHTVTEGEEVDHSFISKATVKFNKALDIYNEYSKALDGKGWF